MSSTSYPKLGPEGPAGPIGNTGAQGPTGAGYTARTLLSTTSLGGLSTVSISAPSGYSDLYLELTGIYSATDGDRIRLQYNGDTSASYNTSVGTSISSTADTYLDASLSSSCANTLAKSAFQKSYISIKDYSSSNIFRITQVLGISYPLAASTGIRKNDISCFYNSATPISTISLYLQSAGTFTAGSAKLYGIM
jgi:hypothetical protein